MIFMMNWQYKVSSNIIPGCKKGKSRRNVFKQQEKMVLRCVICKEWVTNRQRRCFSFPTEEFYRKRWLRACMLVTAPKHGGVCEDHFNTSDLCSPGEVRLRLRKEVVPSVNLPSTSGAGQLTEAPVEATELRQQATNDAHFEAMSTPRGDQQFCLRWNSFHSNLASAFHSLRSDEEFVDVTLAAEGQLIKAHRVVLSACSPFFREILKSAPCHHPVVVLHEVRAAHVRDLLSFMYRGQVTLSPSEMPEFLRAAQALHVKGLFEDMQPPTASEGKEGAPPWSAPPPPPPPLDSRPPSKRPDPSSCEPPQPASKRARPPSPLASALEPAVKIEPVSPPPPVPEIRLKEEGAEGAGSEQQGRHSGRAAETAASAEPATSSRHQPVTSQESSRHPPASQESSRSHPTPQERARSTAAASGSGLSTSHAVSSPSMSSDPDYVVTHTAYQYPCPFCEKSYTSWGFRRRHIKAFHTAGPTLKCKWCWQVLPTHDDWCSHVTGEHHLSAGDAQHAIQILDEANLVLQSSEPLRLDSLVDMVKRHQRKASASPEAALQGAASS